MTRRKPETVNQALARIERNWRRKRQNFGAICPNVNAIILRDHPDNSRAMHRKRN